MIGPKILKTTLKEILNPKKQRNKALAKATQGLKKHLKPIPQKHSLEATHRQGRFYNEGFCRDFVFFFFFMFNCTVTDSLHQQR